MTAYKLRPDVDLNVDDVRDSKGRRITEEYAERAVADALERIGRGRPSLPGSTGRSPQVTFRVTPELKARAQSEAERQGRRVSDVARDALERYLAS